MPWKRSSQLSYSPSSFRTSLPRFADETAKASADGYGRPLKIAFSRFAPWIAILVSNSDEYNRGGIKTEGPLAWG
jgi:hypothetical protein